MENNLKYTTKNGWKELNDQEISNAFAFCEDYKQFLDKGKTERECAALIEKLALDKGFLSLQDAVKNNKCQPGTKVFHVSRKKTVILAVIGEEDIVNGVNMIGAHIDAPRIDLKQNPLYEDVDSALLKTHYYGGIKKYQWVTLPLALHGVFIKGNGETVNVRIGSDIGDPAFVITDLLPHLAADQMQKKLSEAITGEGLNLLIGSIPDKDKSTGDKDKSEKDLITKNILKILNEKYGVCEEDFVSAELEIVPAHNAVDIGFDRSMIGAYGQDDRVCSYGALEALFHIKTPKRTSICVLTDKEEIGSMGNTGAKSVILENFILNLLSWQNKTSGILELRNCLEKSKMLSADVNPGVDSNYKDVQDLKNAAYLGKGIVIEKYTGSRGKSGGSDANAEFVGEIRKMLNDNHIIWQTGELGKVDQGGGGTIAQFVANLGTDVLDCGVAILSMHSPLEITSKIDIYINYLANKAFYEM